MKAERQKLARLLRLERVRAIARQTAATEAARAEGTLAQLQALMTRSSDLAANYAARRDMLDGAELRRLALFSDGLATVCRNTRADTTRAQTAADLRQAELAEAERRRAAVADRAAASRAVIAGERTPVLTARRQGRDE